MVRFIADEDIETYSIIELTEQVDDANVDNHVPTFRAKPATGDSGTLFYTGSSFADRDESGVAFSIGGEPILIRSAATEDGSPDNGRIVASAGGVFRYLGKTDVSELKWFLPVQGGGGIAATPTAVIVEPCRRPLFQNIAPNPHADANTPEGNVARCMGTIKLPGKIYEPIQAMDENGEILEDEDGNPLYLKARVPRTGSGRFVLRKPETNEEPDDEQDGEELEDDADENYLSTAEPLEWIYVDGSEFPHDDYIENFEHYFLHPDNLKNVQNWETTTDPKEAQYNYDYAVCYNMDWSEMLIEGDKVEIDGRQQTADGSRETFIYYEVKAPDEYLVAVEGQGDVELHVITPAYDLRDDPVSYEEMIIDSQTNDQPSPPDFEAVYLYLKDDRCTPEMLKIVGICNDCTSLRVRGVFIREDAKKRRYPMLFEVAQLRAGGAIRTRDVSCYYKTATDPCAPHLIQPMMKLQRIDGWRLSLSPTVCATTCTELVDPASSEESEDSSQESEE